MLKLTLVLSGLAILATGICQPAHANAQTTKPQTFYVGTCKPGKADYTTIQEAVAGVPPGSIVDVCPGSYPEQVTIQQPLTLQAVQTGNNASVVITAPSNGLLSTTIPVAIPIAAQLAVSNSSGPVNISGLTVDGTGITASSSGSPVAGILYNSSPGTLNRVVIQNLMSTNVEVFGVAFRDDNAVSPTNALQNSVISFPSVGNGNAFGGIGIGASTVIAVGSLETFTSSTGTISLSVTNNYFSTAPGNPAFAIFSELNVAATITGNTIAGAISSTGQTTSTGTFVSGIIVSSPTAPVKINGNSIFDATDAIVVQQGGRTSLTLSSDINIVNNTLAPSATGVFLLGGTSVATITGNQIVPATIKPAGQSGSQIGIDFGCGTTLPTVSGNNFMGTSIALNNVPNGISLQKNAGNFINVPTIEQLCQ